MRESADELRTRRLLEVGRTLVTELDLDTLLDRVLEAAREITGARYAALGILNDRRTELAQFLTAGVDEATHAAIGDLPRGRGVLGVLIEHPEPLRLGDVGDHPRSYGFPTGHPVMRGFLGVPISIRGQTWGNLYLAEKRDGDFTEEDQEAAVVLADWAAVAIDNARLFEVSEHRREELERAVRGLEATRDVAVAIGGEFLLDPVLELIAKRGRALVGARSLVIMLREGEELVVRAAAGHVDRGLGARLTISETTSGQVLEHRRPERIVDVPSRLANAAATFGVADARTALLVPMVYRGEAVGVLAAFDRGEDAAMFTVDDEQTLRAFAVSAATAVAMAQSVQADRLRSSLAAADAERRRWARELHDETLQGLGGLRLLLSSALRTDELARSQQAMRDAIERIEQEIGNLRSIITDLRPAALDELGLRTAIEALLDRHRGHDALEIEHELGLPGPGTGARRFDEGLEMAAFRLVQEALNNVVKHAGASRVRVAVVESDEMLIVEVQDDGGGFDTTVLSQGFGLAGMRERVALVDGTLHIESGERGTLVCARMPCRERTAAAANGSVAKQAAS
ncbi:MAG TPA: GAF domain-containing protein [Solirubrobacteraceae bacterium]|nr:GAF domain-containing protein [Solirubrobacteraceae bacterium]